MNPFVMNFIKTDESIMEKNTKNLSNSFKKLRTKIYSEKKSTRHN